MRWRLALTPLLTTLGAGLSATAAQAATLPAPAARCAALARLAVPQARDLKVSAVAAGAYALPQGAAAPSGLNLAGQAAPATNPAFCRIAFTLAPSAESAIRTEVWLPLKGWNGKLLGVGNFGWGGEIKYANLLAGLSEGYAVAGNDTGHDGDGGAFLLGHPQRLEDYAWRANHLMTVEAKALLRRFYGRGAAHAYFIGCSLGGLQALIEAKRFPMDYDGVVAGAPPNPLIDFNAAQLYPGWLVARTPAGLIAPERLAMVARAVIARCATPVGKAQGFLDTPESCHFDPATLLCPATAPAEDAPDCLTAAQVALLRKVYTGPRDPRSGAVIFPGPALGSEEGLMPFISTRPFRNASDLFGYAAFNKADWDPGTLDWVRDMDAAHAALGDRFRVTPQDLKPFLARGGRLLLYVGWNDYHNPAELMAFAGQLHQLAPASGGQLRLFTIPGMAHCAGGAGCDTFSKLDVMDRWATTGTAPERIEVTKYDDHGQPLRQRPACAWPSRARYKGAGDINAASSFECVAG